ncbi:Carboxysome shell and ethanolamine utilization microcompartment protein CcmL/EutN [Granulicatella balaenopterae]|uniref:Carboxysome shell and ethanolamine utilization microcompartment protein CcmL/EutN n=1 Tax=Granulicatella balaenopterae TaxID=137733 RepID=A0A1H9HAP4_9LACT|nr:BMC domain-containing protein [Granulicatella balaenopterae]SEQ59346.1 Carboxysome shell and ethanolamine utilization microcompartment protein CcmL/EutN [Granulicatella balaenopterae]
MEALGMIETIGTIAAIEAGDAMVKSADVSIVSKEFVGGGIVTIIVQGDVMAVKTAVDAGVASVKRLADDALLTEHVIPRPDNQLSLIVNKPQVKAVELEEIVVEQLPTNEIIEEVEVIEVDSIKTEEKEDTKEETSVIEVDSVTVNQSELEEPIEVEVVEDEVKDSSKDKQDTKESEASEKVVYTKKQLNSLTVSKLKDIIRKDENLTLPTKKMSKKELIQMILNK